MKIYRPEKQKQAKKTFNPSRLNFIPVRNKDDGKELPPKQKNFAREYIKDYNGTQAALRAGYSVASAHVLASNFLRKSKVRQIIEDHEKNLATRFLSSKEKILKELSLIAHSDLADYLTKDGEIKVENLSELPPQISRAVKKLRIHTIRRVVKSRTNGGPPDELVERHVDFELYDKLAALEKMGKEIGLFVDRKELTGKDGMPLMTQSATKIVFDFGDGETE